MQCAVRCYEGMKDWERAELWVRRLSERYPDSSVREWLNFCKRTGHGDIAAARALVEQFGADAGEPGSRPPLRASPRPLGGRLFRLAARLDEGGDGQHAQGIRVHKSAPGGLRLLVLADELGDAAQRDAILDDLRTKHRAKAPQMFEVLEMFRDSFARGDRELPDLKALDRAVDNVKPNARGNTEFYVGWLLKKRGKGQDAEAYLKRCIETGPTNAWLKRIADAALHRGTGDPVPAKAGPPVPK